MRYIGEEDVRAVLGYEALIAAVRQGLLGYSAGAAAVADHLACGRGRRGDRRRG